MSTPIERQVSLAVARAQYECMTCGHLRQNHLWDGKVYASHCTVSTCDCKRWIKPTAVKR